MSEQECLIKNVVERAIEVIRIDTPEARQAALDARNAWHAYVEGLRTEKDQENAIASYLEFFIRRIEEESLPRNWY